MKSVLQKNSQQTELKALQEELLKTKKEYQGKLEELDKRLKLLVSAELLENDKISNQVFSIQENTGQQMSQIGRAHV